MNLNSDHIIQFRSNGKLMLTGEYLVLKGAKALALPLRYGQDLFLEETQNQTMLWESKVSGKNWFLGEFDLPSLNIVSCNEITVAHTLQSILKTAKELNSNFLIEGTGFHVQSEIDFNLQWGLGSSSSLISNISYWANCDPYELNRRVFKGSGYDIACARSNKAVLYQLINSEPIVKKNDFNPPFSDQLYFVWLNRKQDTREGIGKFERSIDYNDEIKMINEITNQMILTESFDVFQVLMKKHEEILARILRTIPVQQLLFNDFNGAVKSLGAWGGDFIMVASAGAYSDLKNYFKQKGFNTVLKYNEVVLNK